MGNPVNVAVIDRTTLVPEGDVAAAVRALQVQVNEHFAPHWGVGANLYFVGKSTPVPSAMWWLVIVDDPESAGILGFHETTPDGLPIGFVSVRASIDNGAAWTTVASHELLEMLGDPFIFSVVQMPHGSFSPWPAYTFLEVCDWVEGASYESMGVLLSDFVLPSAFGVPQSAQAGNRYSLLDTIASPFSLAPGGYMIVIDKNGKVHYVASPGALAYRVNPTAVSRRTRRINKLGIS